MSVTRKVGALALACLLGLSTQAFAAQTEVSLVNVAGSRTMTAKSLSGGTLASMAMGSGRESGFLINVSDIAYERRSYQVTAQMSNMYRYDGSTCVPSDKIPSSAFKVQFLPTPTSVTGVAALAQPVLEFAGTIPAAVQSLLGLSTTSIVAPVTESLQSFTNSAVFTGLEDALPIKVATGAGGDFTAPGANADTECGDSGAAIPTAVEVQRGSVSTAQALFDWVQTATDSVFTTASGDGVLTAAEAVTAGLTTDPAVDGAVRDALLALSDTSHDVLITDSVVSQVKAALSDNASSTIDSAAEILGQTGSYTSLPKLVASVPSNTPSGLYKGTLTITLVDPAP